jgi:hypothetical protein
VFQDHGPPSGRSEGGSRQLVDALFSLYLLREIWSSFKDSISKGFYTTCRYSISLFVDAPSFLPLVALAGMVWSGSGGRAVGAIAT